MQVRAPSSCAGALGVLAVGGIVASVTLWRRPAQRDALLVSDAAAHRRHRPSVAEMKLQPDGTVRGTELIVHEDRATDKMVESL